MKPNKLFYIKIILAVFVTVFDIITKIIAQYLLNGAGTINIIGSFISLSYIINTGAAFGIFSNSTIVLSVFVVLFLVVMILYDLKFKENNKMYVVAFALVFGGALGNLYDRLLLGYVRDFIGVGDWFICNIADICVCVGVALYVIYTLFLFEKKEKNNLNKTEINNNQSIVKGNNENNLNTKNNSIVNKNCSNKDNNEVSNNKNNSSGDKKNE